MYTIFVLCLVIGTALWLAVVLDWAVGVYKRGRRFQHQVQASPATKVCDDPGPAPEPQERESYYRPRGNVKHLRTMARGMNRGG